MTPGAFGFTKFLIDGQIHLIMLFEWNAFICWLMGGKHVFNF